jgi:ubiquinone/menaquinone biosynthesis C-methylase UbiE
VSGANRSLGAPLSVKRSPLSVENEQRRLRGVYGGYHASARKQRHWSAENPGNAAIRAELVDTAFSLAGCELSNADAILDIGCGSGWWLERLAGDERISAHLQGVELLPERAAAAQTRVPAAAITLADARELPFEAGNFDVVTLFTVLSSLSSPAEAELVLREVRRVLRPGGALLAWEPRVRNPFNRDTVFIGRPLLERALAGTQVEVRTLTVLPPLARLFGTRTTRLYPRLSRIALLHTHRLVRAGVPGDWEADSPDCLPAAGSLRPSSSGGSSPTEPRQAFPKSEPER